MTPSAPFEGRKGPPVYDKAIATSATITATTIAAVQSAKPRFAWRLNRLGAA